MVPAGPNAVSILFFVVMFWLGSSDGKPVIRCDLPIPAIFIRCDAKDIVLPFVVLKLYNDFGGLHQLLPSDNSLQKETAIGMHIRISADMELISYQPSPIGGVVEVEIVILHISQRKSLMFRFPLKANPDHHGFARNEPDAFSEFKLVVTDFLNEKFPGKQGGAGEVVFVDSDGHFLIPVAAENTYCF